MTLSSDIYFYSNLRTYLPVLGVFILALSMTFLAYSYVHKQKISEIHKDFIQTIDDYERNFKALLTSRIQTLDSVKLFFNASNFVDKNEFHRFVDPVLHRIPDLSAIHYAPLLKYDTHNTNYDVEQPDIYAPILYSAHTDDTYNLAGYNIASLPIFMNAIENVKNNNVVSVYFYTPGTTDAPDSLSDHIVPFQYIESAYDENIVPRQKGLLIASIDFRLLHRTALSTIKAGGLEVSFDRTLADFEQGQIPTLSHARNLNIFYINRPVLYTSEIGHLLQGTKQEYTILIVGAFISLIISAYGFLLLKQRLKDRLAQQTLNVEIQEKERLNTKMRSYTEQIEKSHQEAENANQIKSEFLANMSHELRTPLNSIIGMSEILVEDAKGIKLESKMVNTINKSALSLLEIVNDILDLSKIEAKKIVLEKISFNFKDIVDTIIDTLTPMTITKGIDLHYRDENTELPNLLGDPTRLNKILMNLISNAVKYTDKGHVEIQVDYSQKGDSTIDLICHIVDTGIGIPEDKQILVFKKFTQADETTTRKYGGTGLGLAIAKELVELMGGEMGVESKNGKGSTFWFKLSFETTGTILNAPIQTKYSNKTKHSNAQRINVQDANILVAEDNEHNQALIEALMLRAGFKSVKTVENGTLAVEEYKYGEYNIILMDCHMPDKSGYQATEEIRILEEMTGKRIPIIALTADAMTGTREKCIEAGMDDYISKPFDSVLFKDLLNRWFLFPDINS